jgi:hypothetical protein
MRSYLRWLRQNFGLVLSALLLGQLVVLAWPRLRCRVCDEKFWGWELRGHVLSHLGWK